MSPNITTISKEKLLANTHSQASKHIPSQQFTPDHTHKPETPFLNRPLSNETREKHHAAQLKSQLENWFKDVKRLNFKSLPQNGGPDFLLTIENQKVYVDTKVVHLNLLKGKNKARETILINLLKDLPFPYVIEVLKAEFPDETNLYDLKKEIINWLRIDPDGILVHLREPDIHVVLSKKKSAQSNFTEVSAGIRFNPHILLEQEFKKILNKITTYANDPTDHIPYVIAVLIEDPEIILSKLPAPLFRAINSISENDNRSPKFQNSHQSIDDSDRLKQLISGALIFKRRQDEKNELQNLDFCYFENPLSETKLDFSSLLTKHKIIKLSKPNSE